ncbi:MAG: hypothetical protein N4A32_08700 [Marinifilaceae bacterium]|jgi:hypothetical protein|nr:hypothetical protein [Marinifilaceae bacterium]
MSRINFKGEEEEHNFWQNYTDLMSGFLIVFIIASLVSYSSYKLYEDLYKDKGITEGNINDIIVNAELFNKIKAFQDAQKSLCRKYFEYNEKYNRFEAKNQLLFNPGSSIIPKGDMPQLIAAGKELEQILSELPQSKNVGFKVILNGRRAMDHKRYPEYNYSNKERTREAQESYKRAQAIYRLWVTNNLFSAETLAKYGCEMFICGSGIEGANRYNGFGKNGEDKNKTVIIQIIPYLNLNK